MKSNHISTVLPFVQKPSRYIGGEINSIKSDTPHQVSFALCFPDVYEIGTAHFGLQILYHILNKKDGIIAERVFAPGRDMEAHLKNIGLSLFSLEAKRPLTTFDVVGFSMLYELNVTNVLMMLNLSQIPFYAAQRDDSFPLIIAGGPCMFNPEPVADFFDAVVIGDGETVVAEMADVLLAVKKDGGRTDKKSVLQEWSRLKGVYIPQWYEARYDDQGYQCLIPGPDAPETVQRAIEPFLKREDFPDAPVLPFGKPVHDRLRLEIARGCSRGCRFCQAGMVYRPVRERSVADILSMTEAALINTGYEDISLLSLSTGDYGGLNRLMEQLVNRYGEKNKSLSVPSFRAGTLDTGAMQLIQRIRKTGFTIAPEAGSQRLREVINKNITEAEIAQTVNNAFTLGWNLIKLYFMIGLPTETDHDVEEIIELVYRLLKLGNQRSKRQKLHISVATFIPKAHTPFQWEPQIPLDKAKDTISFLKKRLATRRIGFKWQNPETSFMEGVFARGDRRLAKLIEKAYSKGCRFDGWSDSFNFQLWLDAAAETAVDLDFYTTRPRDISEPLPWDRISSGISKEFLLRERDRAYQQKPTPDCRQDVCNDCGICDFSETAPRLIQPETVNSSAVNVFIHREENHLNDRKLEIVYSKTGSARFFGHLEFISIFIRAINRANIPVVYSQGFHPMPRVVFPEPLPVGMESEHETMMITVAGHVRPDTVKLSLNQHLPAGIMVKSCRTSSEKPGKKKAEAKIAVYRIETEHAAFDRDAVDRFWMTDRFLIEKTKKDGTVKTIDLKEIVSKMTVIDKNRLEMEIWDRSGKKARPTDIAGALFGLEPETILSGRVIKVCCKS